MTAGRVFLLTALALIAFAANSVLARLALLHGEIGPWGFTLIRLLSGAVMLAVLVGPGKARRAGNWVSALALVAYAGFFSFAYIVLPTGTGALILFALVQITMVGTGLYQGERLNHWQWTGAGLAMLGLVALLGPGIGAPSPIGAMAMALSGVSWGVYSVRGRGAGDPGQNTAGNFGRAALMASLLAVPVFLIHPETMPSTNGIWLALASGVITSGLGYTIWYMALKGLSASRAGIAQLSVPALAAAGGVMVVGEALTLRFVLSSLIILGGIALVMLLTPKRVPK